ncbi:MAG: hypothetical protein NC402_02320 [Prevotella sp.]|nr:hypothetical protein [Prevotella sp.]MCM1074636.1 hypothetical protein [Ruminococcus sp.]
MKKYLMTGIVASVFVGSQFLFAAADYNLVITQKNGSKIEIPTEDIENIVFDEPVKQGTVLETPYVNVVKTDYSDFMMQWTSIPNAKGYEWTVDGRNPTVTESTQFKIYNIAEGTHTVSVRALAANDDYVDSEPAVKEIVADFRVKTALGDVTENSIAASFTANCTHDYFVGVVAEVDCSNPANMAAYITANAQKCQRTVVNGSQQKDVNFTGLEAGTNYNVVAYSEGLDYCFATASKTVSTQTYEPGAKGKVFPNGVSEQGGFWDVDKVGDTTARGLDDSDDQTGKGGDNELCWGCTASGMIQWWLDEYERQTGEKCQLKAELPSHGLYSTNVMEAIVRAYPNVGGDAREAIKWFFAGVTNNSTLNEVPTYNENYANWKGGFVGMTNEEALSYFHVSAEASDGYNEYPYVFHRTYSMRGLDLNQAKKKFARILIETLEMGPAGLVVPAHSLAIWGCEYEVDADGDPIITNLYIGENGINDGNVKNGLNVCPMQYKSPNEFWFYLPSMHDGGSVNTTRINYFFGLKGYKAK